MFTKNVKIKTRPHASYGPGTQCFNRFKSDKEWWNTGSGGTRVNNRHLNRKAEADTLIFLSFCEEHWNILFFIQYYNLEMFIHIFLLQTCFISSEWAICWVCYIYNNQLRWLVHHVSSYGSVVRSCDPGNQKAIG